MLFAKAWLAVSCPNQHPSFHTYFSMPEFQRIADAIATVASETGKPPMRLALCQWGRVSGRTCCVG